MNKDLTAKRERLLPVCLHAHIAGEANCLLVFEGGNYKLTMSISLVATPSYRVFWL